MGHSIWEALLQQLACYPVWTKPSKEGSVTEANEHNDSFFIRLLVSILVKVCVVLYKIQTTRSPRLAQLLELQIEPLHREVGEGFSPQRTDNLLAQQLLNLSCLSKEPICLTSNCSMQDQLSAPRYSQPNNDSFLSCNKRTLDFFL